MKGVFNLLLRFFGVSLFLPRLQGHLSGVAIGQSDFCLNSARGTAEHFYDVVVQLEEELGLLVVLVQHKALECLDLWLGRRSEV